MSKSKHTMTESERVEAVLRREKPDRIPVWPFFSFKGLAAVYCNRPIADAYRDPSLSLQMQRKLCKDLGWVCSPNFSCLRADDFGGETKLPEGEFSQAISVTRYPIENEDDVWKLTMPDVRNLPNLAREEAFYKLKSSKPFVNEPFGSHLLILSPFDLTAELCPLEKLLRWMLKKPEILHHLLRFSTDVLIEATRYWYDTFGTKDVLVMGVGVRSSNQIISPARFEQFALPYHKELHQKVLAMGYKHICCHICGEHNLNMPYWAQVPMGDPGIISIGHEVELETAARYFPNDVILGNLEPVILQTGTPEEVYEATRKVIERGKKLGGRYIFALGCEIPPWTSLDNAKAMNKAVDDFGWYS
jgi:uroporphyrinogen decarboxylase